MTQRFVLLDRTGDCSPVHFDTAREAGAALLERVFGRWFVTLDRGGLIHKDSQGKPLRRFMLVVAAPGHTLQLIATCHSRNRKSAQASLLAGIVSRDWKSQAWYVIEQKRSLGRYAKWRDAA